VALHNVQDTNRLGLQSTSWVPSCRLGRREARHRATYSLYDSSEATEVSRLLQGVPVQRQQRGPLASNISTSEPARGPCISRHLKGTSLSSYERGPASSEHLLQRESSRRKWSRHVKSACEAQLKPH
jgi:hypothetical protein